MRSLHPKDIGSKLLSLVPYSSQEVTFLGVSLIAFTGADSTRRVLSLFEFKT